MASFAPNEVETSVHDLRLEGVELHIR